MNASTKVRDLIGFFGSEAVEVLEDFGLEVDGGSQHQTLAQLCAKYGVRLVEVLKELEYVELAWREDTEEESVPDGAPIPGGVALRMILSPEDGEKEITVLEVLNHFGPSAIDVLWDFGVDYDDWDRELTLVELCDEYELDLDEVAEALAGIEGEQDEEASDSDYIGDGDSLDLEGDAWEEDDLDQESLEAHRRPSA
jgi:hypothetical protein